MNPAECRRPAKWRYLAANPGECQCRPPLKMGNCLASLFGEVAGAEVASLPSASLPHCLVVAQKTPFRSPAGLVLARGLICSNTPLSLTFLHPSLAILLDRCVICGITLTKHIMTQWPGAFSVSHLLTVSGPFLCFLWICLISTLQRDVKVLHWSGWVLTCGNVFNQINLLTEHSSDTAFEVVWYQSNPKTTFATSFINTLLSRKKAYMTDRHTTEGGQKHPFSHSWLVEVRLFQLCFLDKGALAGLQLDSH